MNGTAQIIASILVPLLVAWIAMRGNIRVKHEEATTAPYDSMKERLARVEERNDQLESRVSALEGDRLVDRQFIRDVISWSTAQQLVFPFPLPHWYTTEKEG